MEKENGVLPHVHIIRRPKGYAVYSNNLRPYGTFATLPIAMKKAEELQKKQGGTIVVHREDGVVVKEHRPAKPCVHFVSDPEEPPVASRQNRSKSRRLKTQYA